MSSVALTVSRVTIDPGNATAVPPVPRTIVFQIKKPFGGPNVYIGVLTLIENTGLNGIDGVVPSGTAPDNPGTCDAQMASNLFSPIWDFLPNHTRLVVTIAYLDDGSCRISNISIGSTLAAVSPSLLEHALPT
jgi:hypothetical protein